MRRPFSISGIACSSMFLLALAAGPASAQFDDAQLKCRATIAKSGTKLAKSVFKAIALCHKNRNTDVGLDATDCNDIAIADIDSKVVIAVEKFGAKIAKSCTGQTPSAMLYEGCPTPCSQAFPALTTITDLSGCLACVTKSRIEDTAVAVFTEPDPKLEKSDGNCHKSITLVTSKLASSILKAVTKCQADAEDSGATTVTGCTDTDYATIVAELVSDAGVMLGNAHCSGVTFPNTDLDACGLPDTLSELVACVTSNTKSGAKTLVTDLLSLPEENVTTTSTTSTSTTTSTTLPAADPLCPAAADLTLRGRDSGATCVNPGDCTAPYTCNAGRCTSPTDDDFGWTGLNHDNDGNAGDVLRVGLNCEGPASPGCGTCAVTGIDPAAGYCRCSNDTRVKCDEAFASSPECGGNVCNCYASTPTPIVATGTPACMVRRLVSDPSGAIDVDLGTSSLDLELREMVYLGIAVPTPCPTCGGTCADAPAQLCNRDADCETGTCTLDPVANDGIRSGTCTGGASEGLGCDVMSTNSTFPARPNAEGPNGGAYSLDCMPSPAYNIAGAGLLLDIPLGTGASSLPSNLSCGGPSPELDCPCLMCSGATASACASDADCSGQPGRCSLSFQSSCNDDAGCLDRNVGPCLESTDRCALASTVPCSTDDECEVVDVGICTPSTCSEIGTVGQYPLPNFCDDLACTDLGGGEGECTTGPDNSFCDGVLRPDGSGVFLCQTDFDCGEGVVGVDAGECTLSERLECLPEPAAASGVASDTHPVVAATYCMPATSNSALNDISGLPGPARSVRQLSIVSYCGSDPDVTYTPDTGGCP